MNTNNKGITLYTVLGTLALIVSVLVCSDWSDDYKADEYLNKLRFERINVYLDIHQR